MKIKINFEKNGKDVNKEISLDFKSIAKHVVNSATKIAKKAEEFIASDEESAGEVNQNTENDASKAKEQVFENNDDFIKKVEESASKIIENFENIDNLAKKAEERADQVIAKVDGFIKQVEDHLVKKVFEKDDSDKTDENDSVSGEGKSNSEKDIHFEETLGDGDDYPDEVDEIEAAKIALKNKISQIPEGETFTLAEYLDYTEEGNCIKDTSVFDYRSEIFLDAIKFPWSPEALDAFSHVANLKKPSYEVLSKKLSAKYNRDVVKELKKDFETWLKGRPDVKKYCPKANLWHLLLYYRKKVNEVIKK